MHDGIGIWLAARRLHQGRFTWPASSTGASWSLSPGQLDALVLGLPWQRIGESGVLPWCELFKKDSKEVNKDMHE